MPTNTLEDVAVDKLSAKQLLDQSFSIPPFQRKYDWQEKHARQLLEDLKDAHRDSAGNMREQSSYFLNMIMTAPSASRGQGVSDLIDGQQRITTITLLVLAAARLSKDALAHAGTTNSQITETLFGLVSERDDLLAEESNRTQRLGTINSHPLINLLLNKGEEPSLSDIEDLGLNAKNMLGVYSWFRTTFKEMFGLVEDMQTVPSQTVNPQEIREKSQKMARFVTEVLRRTTIGEIKSSSSSVAKRFISLNARGLELSQADIVKATLLSSIPEGQEDVLEEGLRHWGQIDHAIDKFREHFSRAGSNEILYAIMIGSLAKDSQAIASLKGEDGGIQALSSWLADPRKGGASLQTLYGKNNPEIALLAEMGKMCRQAPARCLPLGDKAPVGVKHIGILDKKFQSHLCVLFASLSLPDPLFSAVAKELEKLVLAITLDSSNSGGSNQLFPRIAGDVGQLMTERRDTNMADGTFIQRLSTLFEEHRKQNHSLAIDIESIAAKVRAKAEQSAQKSRPAPVVLKYIAAAAQLPWMSDHGLRCGEPDLTKVLGPSKGRRTYDMEHLACRSQWEKDVSLRPYLNSPANLFILEAEINRGIKDKTFAQKKQHLQGKSPDNHLFAHFLGSGQKMHSLGQSLVSTLGGKGLNLPQNIKTAGALGVWTEKEIASLERWTIDAALQQLFPSTISPTQALSSSPASSIPLLPGAAVSSSPAASSARKQQGRKV